MYYEKSADGYLHFVRNSDGFIDKVFISKEKCIEFIKDN